MSPFDWKNIEKLREYFNGLKKVPTLQNIPYYKTTSTNNGVTMEESNLWGDSPNYLDLVHKRYIGLDGSSAEETLYKDPNTNRMRRQDVYDPELKLDSLSNRFFKRL